MIGIVIPLWIHKNPAILDMTERCVSRLKCSEPVTVFISCTRLHLISAEDLAKRLSAKVLYEPNVERSVAGAWNWGMRESLTAGCEFICATANDVLMEDTTLDTLIKFGRSRPEIDLWSGLDMASRTPGLPGTETEGCDFACFMVRPSTVAKHGWFDEHYRPAYFEDNDYYTRVILGGGECRVIHDARFWHLGSMTKKLEGDARHHVDHWYGINRRRYAEKWGPGDPPGTAAGVRAECRQNPWGDSGKPLWAWDGSPPRPEIPLGSLRIA